MREIYSDIGGCKLDANLMGYLDYLLQWQAGNFQIQIRGLF
jgi:hypothetical protein